MTTTLKPSRSDRPYAEALAEARSQQPKHCPACGSTRIQPTFITPSQWDCESCAAFWDQE